MTVTIKLTSKRSQLQRYMELLYVLVERNLKTRYRGSFLGVYWSLLNPLIMTGLYTAIFGTAFAAYFDNSIIDYVLAAFTGLAAIHFFSGSTSQALVSIVDNGALLNKMKLPISIFPISIIGANVFQFSVGMLPILIVITLLKSKSIVNLIALFCPLIALCMVCMGIGFLVSSLYIFFRDLPFFYELVTFVAWMSSPVFYPPEIVPESVKNILILNPLLPIIESIRQIALSKDLPDLSLMAHSSIGGLIILSIGWSCFSLWRSQFMDLL